MKKNIIIFFIFIITTNSFAQTPSIEWQSYFGGSSFDSVQDQIQTLDGGYILIGTTISKEIPFYDSNTDILVIKISNLGILEWQKAIGGGLNDSGANIIQTADGGYLICGATSSNNGTFPTNYGETDIYLLKLDFNGNVLWQKNYGGSNIEYGGKVIALSDGSYLVSGSTYSADGDISINHGDLDFWLVKVNSLGVIEWQKTYGGNNYDGLADIIKTSDGGYIFTGESLSYTLPNHHGSGDFLVIKTDSLGNIVWQKCFGGSSWDYSSSIIQTSDGDFIVGGSTQSTNGNLTSNHGGFFDFWILKINSSGTIVWQNTYGGSGGEQLTDIKETIDGNYIISGLSDSNDGDITTNNGGNDFWILKITQNGALIWQKSIGSSANEVANCIMQSADGGYLVSGTTAFNGLISSDVWTVKLSIESLGIDEFVPPKNKIIVYPNAITDYFKINDSKLSKLTVFSLDGKIVKQFDKQDKYYIDELLDGIYIIKIFNETNEIQTLKIVKI